MRLLLRNLLPVVIVTVALAASFVLALIVAMHIPGGPSLGGCQADSPCLQPNDIRVVIGIVLVLGVPLNGIALAYVIRAALRPPRDGIMDERLQHFMIAGLASLAFCTFGLYELVPHHLRFLGSLADVGLILGILIYVGLPILFLRAIWKSRGRKD